MTKCYQTSNLFPRLQRREITANFSGGDITSDAGALLLRNADRKLGLSKAITRALGDERRQASCQHSLETLVRQRLYALCLGYEDLNDHDTLRHDAGLQTAVDKLSPVASASTLCRLEQRADRGCAVRLHQLLIDQFIRSHTKAPRRLILDFDATDDRVHGNQEGRFFHGYYDHYCFLPLYVFCGRQLLVSYLRPSKIDGAKHAWAILALLVKQLRQEWPNVEILFRGDSGFCRWRMLNWCDRNNVKYLVGLARNNVLEKKAKPFLDLAEQQYELRARKQRHFHDMVYGAKTWGRKRRVILKAEFTDKGRNPRFVTTNLTQTAQYLYDEMYCARGDMENRIKDQQLDLFADRTSCHRWWPNQFRLLLSSLAWTLMEALRASLQNTELKNASPGTLRLKLLKIGAVVLRNTRRIQFKMNSSYPYQSIFHGAALALSPG